MVEKDILKKIVFLKNLPDHMVEKIGALANIETYDKNTILFKQNQEHVFLYMLVSGKVVLNRQSASGKSLTLDEISEGLTFGVSALMDELFAAFNAICAEPSSIITVSGKKIRQLCEADFEIGHRLMVNVVETLRSSSQMHTDQFLHSLASHPEIR